MKNILEKDNVNCRNYFPGILKAVTKIFLTSIIIVLFIGIYVIGLFQGYIFGVRYERETNISYFNNQEIKNTPTPIPTIILTPTPITKPNITPNSQITPKISWGGPELWEAVNKKRVELGVNSLSH